ncbi:MAG TPA: thiamine pyrophosphate-dependent dehydrogenase E1 component subunit alpha [Candidatus Acidoferrales bacterium]|nr:thiamine pyrophosphate-dependent dehydrogenase E1 component subunit alpha [Candidatus Acidoferrales bacterium]
MTNPLTREQHLDLYYYMQLNRQLEDRMVRLFRQNKIVGGLYSSLGQEAVSVGTAYALERRDWMAPMIRNIGALLVKGVPPRDIFTQHMAKYTSPTKGKDGTSHFGDLKVRHIVSPISMLGDLIPVMTGVAMGGRYLGQKIVTMTWIGDGGSSTGAFHEGMGLAASQRAPFVLIVENNQWAYSTPVTRQVPVKNLADRAAAYGVESAIVDGNDVVAVYGAAKEAVDECRAGRGPRLIEVKTMRMKGHAQHDPAEYVPEEMFAYWKARDPIVRYEKYLRENGIWDAKAKSEIDARIERELDAEQKFAEESPMPPPETAEEGVYCENGCHTIEVEWKRAKSEVTPPQSSIEAAWKVNSFGAFEDAIEGVKPGAAVSTGSRGNGSKANGSAEKAPARTKATDEKGKALAAKGAGERTPFGRGPKGKQGKR